MATVKGDIHDIGKNIVKVLLDNYGYTVVDLGRDVDPQLIVDTAVEQNITNDRTFGSYDNNPQEYGRYNKACKRM